MLKSPLSKGVGRRRVMVEKSFASAKPTETLSPWELRKRLTFAVLGSLSLSDDIPSIIITNTIYSAFYDLKSRYPKWLGSLYFETSGSTISCKNLEDVLFSLGAFGLVTVENHDFRRLRFEPRDRKIAKEKVCTRMKDDGNLEELKNLSNEFAKIVQAPIDASL